MRIIVLAVCLLCAGCSTTDAGFTPVGKTYEARAADHEIEIFIDDERPSRPFEKVAVLDVHFETMAFGSRNFEEASSKLEEQARAAGGDAVLGIKETNTKYLENSIYHVTATAIRYTD